jgi:hypothetical protein
MTINTTTGTEPINPPHLTLARQSPETPLAG